MSPLWDRADLAEAATELDARRLLVERFDYLSKQRSPALLSLAVRMPIELPGQARPVLIVEREAVGQLFSPNLSSTSSVPSGGPGDWLWRGVFAVPSQLLSQPQTAFAVRFLDDLLLPLPAPAARRMGYQSISSGRARTWPYAVRRGALLLIVTCQLCVLPGFSTDGALADGPTGTPTTSEPAPATPPESGEETATDPEGSGSGEGVPPATPAPEAPAEPAPPAPVEAPSKAPDEQGPQATAGTSSEPDPAPSTPTESFSSAAALPSADGVPAAPPMNGPSTHRVHGSRTLDGANLPVGPRKTADGDRTRHGAAQKRVKHAANGSTQDAPAPGPEPAVSSAPVFEGLPAGLAGLAGTEDHQPPAYLIPIYKQAGRRYHVPWRVLAAINQIETDYGQNLSVSSAGAVGWMQFMPATWQEWGVDADHDRFANPYSPQDAIFAAARYLQASGAEYDLARAIFAYNNADWYVAEVLLRARTLGDGATFAPIEKGYSLPLDAPYMQQLGRTDDGVDIETAPDGALVYSITPGVITAVASDPAGFGPNYPVIEASSGSLAGQHIYYGHVAQSLVQPGQQVAAGQPIAIIGHAGDASGLGHGHIEIGFSDAGGAPLDQHGAEAWTPSGSVMRSVLVSLSASFGIDNA
jgi:murein DD-endopeptidase MepM/ murein hydrolase activator NlpD